MPDKPVPVQDEHLSQDEESDEYDVEYDDEEEDGNAEHSDSENDEDQGGKSLTALLLGGDGHDEEGSGDEGWTPDGGPEPAEDSGNETDAEVEEPATPAHLKGKAPAAAKRERDELGDDEDTEAAQNKRTKK